MNPLRSFLAVLVGMGFFRLTVAVLETALVGAVATAPVTNDAEYFAVRNQGAMLWAALGYNVLAALLAGYVTAKVASHEELLHAGVAAAVQTAALAWEYTIGDYAGFTPAWTRVALVLLVGPAMIAGASVRARAARLETPREVES
jgi:hypothetical protein